MDSNTPKEYTFDRLEGPAKERAKDKLVPMYQDYLDQMFKDAITIPLETIIDVTSIRYRFEYKTCVVGVSGTVKPEQLKGAAKRLFSEELYNELCALEEQPSMMVIPPHTVCPGGSAKLWDDHCRVMYLLTSVAKLKVEEAVEKSKQRGMGAHTKITTENPETMFLNFVEQGEFWFNKDGDLLD